MSDQENPVAPELAGAQAKGMQQGDEMNISKLDPGLRKVLIGVGWDFKGADTSGIDMDTSLFLLDRNDQTREDSDFVFYNNLSACGGAVQHTGDNRTGAGDGDDETVFLDLNGIPYDVLRILFVISIYDADMREQNFEHVRNCFLRIVNQETQIELTRYVLDGIFVDAKATAVVVGELSRDGAQWIFKAGGELVTGGLASIATKYGILIAGN